MLNRKEVLVRALAVVFTLAAFNPPAAAGGAPLTMPSPSMAPLLAAPLVSATGTPFHSAVLRGHPLILQFWNTRCAVCRANDRLLRTWGFEYADRGLFVVGVLEQDTRANLNRYERDFALGMVSTVDARQQVARTYGVHTVPTTLFIDTSGHVMKTVRSALAEQDILDGLKLIL